MTPRALLTLAFLAGAIPAAAQMPPMISKPIAAARRQANKTSEQINREQQVGNDQTPPAARQSAAPAAARAGAPAKRDAPATSARSAGASPANAADAAQKGGSVAQRGAKGSVTFYREAFSYDAEGRRDPFLSLMASGELRPMISDLTLVGVIYDESGHNSIAVLVDASAAGQTYRRKVGDVLGRMKVATISENSVTFNIEEFGFARQETLLIDRNPRTGARRPQ